MKTLTYNKAIEILKEHKEEFAIKYGVTQLGFFGSIARRESRISSDFDVVVCLKSPDLLSLVHLKAELESLCGTQVDIVRYREKMNPYLKARIDSEAVYV